MKKTRVLLLILICNFFFLENSFSQIPVCDQWDKYKPTSDKYLYLPVKRIRIVFHVLRDGNGLGNIPDNTDGRNYIALIKNHLNGIMENPAALTGNISSAHIPDTRIRYAYDDEAQPSIYFYDNQTLYDDYLNYSPTTSISTLYDELVETNTNLSINEKMLSIHCFLVSSNTSTASSSGAADTKYVLVRNTGSFYNTGNHWGPATTLCHELAHCLGLEDNTGFENCRDFVRHPSNTYIDEYSNNIMTYFSSQNAFSACQAGKMYAVAMGVQVPMGPPGPNEAKVFHWASNAVIDDWNYYSNEEMVIPTYPCWSTVTWNSKRYLTGDLIIEPEAKLTIECLVHMPPGAHIIVKPGGYLKIDGGTITNLNNEMWGGIIVQGDKYQDQSVSNSPQGKLIMMNGATIELAETGILVGAKNQSNAGGGYIRVDNSNVVDCNIGIEFCPYPDFDNHSFISNSTFICTQILPQFNNCTSDFIKLYDVKSIRIYGNTFRNTIERTVENNNLFRGYGIHSINGDFKVWRNDTDPLDGFCAPDGSPNHFINLTYGIHHSNWSADRSAKIYGNDFEDVAKAIYLSYDIGTLIYDNTFTWNEQNYFMEPSGISAYGSTSSKIIKNMFEWHSGFYYGGNLAGITSANTNASLNIYDNTFEDQSTRTCFGNYLKSDNLSTSLQCNTYMDMAVSWFLKDNAQLCDQGTSFSAAGNIFPLTGISILSTSSFGFDYYCPNPLTPADPETPTVFSTSTNISIQQGNNAHPCNDYNDPCDFYGGRILPGPYESGHAVLNNYIIGRVTSGDFGSVQDFIDALGSQEEPDDNLMQFLTILLNMHLERRDFRSMIESEKIDLINLTDNDDIASALSKNILQYFQNILFEDDAIPEPPEGGGE